MKELKILMIDDHEDDMILVREMLDDAGFAGDLELALGAAAAWEYLEKKRGMKRLEEIGLIFLDLNMPLQNGFELMMELKSDPDFKEIPVVMISGSRREEERQEALLKGAVAYLTKPISFEGLVSAVQGLAMKWSLS